MFTFENNHWVNRCSIYADTLQNRNPFLPTRICLISLSNLSIDDDLTSINDTDWETAFIHIVNILRLNIVFRNSDLKHSEPVVECFMWGTLQMSRFNAMSENCFKLRMTINKTSNSMLAKRLILNMHNGVVIDRLNALMPDFLSHFTNSCMTSGIAGCCQFCNPFS